jgi:hypothetical protein
MAKQKRQTDKTCVQSKIMLRTKSKSFQSTILPPLLGKKQNQESTKLIITPAKKEPNMCNANPIPSTCSGLRATGRCCCCCCCCCWYICTKPSKKCARNDINSRKPIGGGFYACDPTTPFLRSGIFQGIQTIFKNSLENWCYEVLGGAK